MQIVININENEYLSIKEYPNNITSYPVTIHLYDAVRNGTPLPKGHGRLIDADAYIEKYECCGYLEDIEIDYFNEVVPTIIESDKE